MTQLSLAGCRRIILPPDWEDGRGSWCTPDPYATAVGHFDVDPFSNARSIIRSTHACWLERGDDGFGGENSDTPGSFLALGSHRVADEETSVWFQPPYGLVLRGLAHYGHTRFTALLRLDTSTVWCQLLVAGITEDDLGNPAKRDRLVKALKHTHKLEPCPPLCEVVMIPKSDRLEFVPPPGVKASSNPFPHGLYYRRATDVTPEIQALCYEWRVR